jgi:hypothetical protein
MSELVQRAEHAYPYVTSMLTPDAASTHPTTSFPAVLDLFSVPHPSTELFLSSLTPLVVFLEEPTVGKFGVFSLSGLDAIVSTYGKDSERYKLATETLRAMLSSALSHPTLRLVVLTSPVAASHTHAKRQETAPTSSAVPPQLVSDAVCFSTADVCTNSTNSCSGHGSCISARKLGRECFVCSCSTTKDRTGRTQSWAGTSCERKDVSGCVHQFASLSVLISTD